MCAPDFIKNRWEVISEHLETGFASALFGAPWWLRPWMFPNLCSLRLFSLDDWAYPDITFVVTCAECTFYNRQVGDILRYSLFKIKINQWFRKLKYFPQLISGVSYGFQLMSNMESPNIPFTILKTMFPTGKSFLFWRVLVNSCNSLRLHECKAEQRA